MRTDLHIHTTASDGCWTPAQVIEGVQREGIALFAIADHDAVSNVAETAMLAREAGLHFLHATEISTTDEKGRLFHILGYGINIEHPALLTLLTENHAKMEANDDDDIRRLIALGYPLDYEDYRIYKNDRTRGGFKSLNYLIDLGICTDIRDFLYNIRDQFEDPWPQFAHPSEAITAIRAAGGVPVLAHPGSSLKNYGGVTPETLNPFLDYGIAGLECYSQYHDEATTATCLRWCREHHLLITGGSDYHGGFAGRQLGVPIVDSTELQLGSLLKATAAVPI